MSTKSSSLRCVIWIWSVLRGLQPVSVPRGLTAATKLPRTTRTIPQQRLTWGGGKAERTSENKAKLPKKQKKNAPLPKSSGRLEKVKAKNDRMLQLLKFKDGYPPSPAELEAAKRVTDLEDAFKNTKKKKNHEKRNRCRQQNYRME